MANEVNPSLNIIGGGKIPLSSNEQHQDRIKAAKNALKNEPSHHFLQNCLFEAKDLFYLVQQSNCETIIFSHIVVSPNTGAPRMTVMAIGGTNQGFLYDQPMFYAGAVDQVLDYSGIAEITEQDHIETFITEHDHLSYQTTLQNWLSPHHPRRVITDESGDFFGVYFDAQYLLDKGYLTGNRNRRLALVPRKISFIDTTPTPIGQEQRIPLTGITYVLLPVEYTNQINRIVLPSNGKFISSKVPWPSIWNDTFNGITVRNGFC